MKTKSKIMHMLPYENQGCEKCRCYLIITRSKKNADATQWQLGLKNANGT